MTTSAGAAGPGAPGTELYLELMKQCLTNAIYDPEVVDRSQRPTTWYGWPKDAHTMLSLKRLDNIQYCVERALHDGVPGDLIEAGVWRGGATIFMRAVLKAHRVLDRSVWVADSFDGLPPPRPDCPADADSDLHLYRDLAIPLPQVMENFRKYGLLDEQVRFLKGWFSATLPTAPIDRLAVLRLDGDMYESTMDCLTNLYWKLSPGGYTIIDDYGAVPACRTAVHEFRDRHGIEAPLQQIDWTGVYWQKSSAENIS